MFIKGVNMIVDAKGVGVGDSGNRADAEFAALSGSEGFTEVLHCRVGDLADGSVVQFDNPTHRFVFETTTDEEAFKTGLFSSFRKVEGADGQTVHQPFIQRQPAALDSGEVFTLGDTQDVTVELLHGMTGNNRR